MFDAIDSAVVFLVFAFFFFFKQKTAYEIGLGIPAEPLFRSLGSKNHTTNITKIIPMLCVTIFVILVVWFLLPRVARLMIHTRSEERRVGKECRCRWLRL